MVHLSDTLSNGWAGGLRLHFTEFGDESDIVYGFVCRPWKDERFGKNGLKDVSVGSSTLEYVSSPP